MPLWHLYSVYVSVHTHELFTTDEQTTQESQHKVMLSQKPRWTSKLWLHQRWPHLNVMSLNETAASIRKQKLQWTTGNSKNVSEWVKQTLTDLYGIDCIYQIRRIISIVHNSRESYCCGLDVLKIKIIYYGRFSRYGGVEIRHFLLLCPLRGSVVSTS